MNRVWDDRLQVVAELRILRGVSLVSFEKERNGMNNSKETVVACWWLSETSELGIKFSPSEDYKADVSSDSSSLERIRILPCLKRPLAGSVAFKFLNVTLLKADVLLRAKVIVSNSDESLLITPADMRRNQATTKQQNKLSRIFRRGSNWNKRPHL